MGSKRFELVSQNLYKKIKGKKTLHRTQDSSTYGTLKHGKNGFVTATKLGTTDKIFVAATKNFAAATKRFVDRTKHFVVVTK